MTAKARSTDPISSHLAAANAEATSAPAQRERCLEMVKRLPGATSAEIADAFRENRYMTARRLPELRDAGRLYNGNLRTCAVTGRLSLTWFLAGKLF
jgi:hypothetical protein